MKKLFNDDYNYMPETYCYPREQNQIYFKFNNYSFDIPYSPQLLHPPPRSKMGEVQ